MEDMAMVMLMEMESAKVKMGLRDRFPLINRDMEIIYPTDLRLRRVCMDRWKLLPSRNTQRGGASLRRGLQGQEGGAGVDHHNLSLPPILQQHSTPAHRHSNPFLLPIRLISDLKSRTIPVHNLNEGNLGLNLKQNLKLVYNQRLPKYLVRRQLSIADHPAELLSTRVRNSPKQPQHPVPVLMDTKRRRLSLKKNDQSAKRTISLIG
jgi:hypothetical protein